MTTSNYFIANFMGNLSPFWWPIVSVNHLDSNRTHSSSDQPWFIYSVSIWVFSNLLQTQQSFSCNYSGPSNSIFLSESDSDSDSDSYQFRNCDPHHCNDDRWCICLYHRWFLTLIYDRKNFSYSSIFNQIISFRLRSDTRWSILETFVNLSISKYP
jgi:hypothetical protein